MPIDELVGAPPTGDPRVHLRPVTRYGMTMVPLTRRAGGLQAYKMIVPGRAVRRRAGQQSHEGYEWLYVLSGRLRLLLGEQDLVLPGEAAEFDTRVPHWFGSADAQPVELLVPVRPAGRTRTPAGLHNGQGVTYLAEMPSTRNVTTRKAER